MCAMAELLILIASAAVTVGAVMILIYVHNGAVDVTTGVALVVALAVLARTAIGLASDTSWRR
jgi:hypothetical protein